MVNVKTRKLNAEISLLPKEPLKYFTKLNAFQTIANHPNFMVNTTPPFQSNVCHKNSFSHFHPLW